MISSSAIHGGSEETDNLNIFESFVLVWKAIFFSTMNRLHTEMSNLKKHNYNYRTLSFSKKKKKKWCNYA